MAIWTPGTGGFIRKEFVGMTFTQGAQGQPVINTPTNNRARTVTSPVARTAVPSPAFQGLDQLILALDAQYDLLPDKTPWLEYAENITAEWQLCANCQPDYGAKKLYRQYNFYRESIGLIVVDAPVDNTEFAATNSVQGLLFLDGSVLLTGVPGAAPQWFIAQAGLALGNPRVLVSPSDLGSFILPGSPIYDFLMRVPVGTQQPCCTCTQTGAPGLKAYTEVDNA